MAIKNILTVDVEEWFHICGVGGVIPRGTWPQLETRVKGDTLKILDILSMYGVKATFFVLGYVALRHPDLIKKIAEAGHDIACHGHSHRRVYAMTPEAFRKDLRKAKKSISNITGAPVKGYRAPEWSIRDDSLWALSILSQEGFEYDSSMAPLPIIGNSRYSRTPLQFKLQGRELWEFPPLVGVTPFFNIPFGGGWGLRVFPYSQIRRSIHRMNRQGSPALVYLHPREFDDRRLPVRLPLVKWLVLNAGVESTTKRLYRLLDEFQFTSIRGVLGDS